MQCIINICNAMHNIYMQCMEIMLAKRRDIIKTVWTSRIRKLEWFGIKFTFFMFCLCQLMLIQISEGNAPSKSRGRRKL